MPAPVRTRPGSLPLAAVALATAFAVLAALVAGGRLTAIDHYALVHWMPDLQPSHATESMPGIEGVVRPFDPESPAWKQVVDLATYPASVLVSALVFAAGCVVLIRRGARTAALVWVTAFVVANVLEVLAKVAIEKPALYASEGGRLYHVAPFDHSFPSGHGLRAVFVAAFLGFVWARLAWPAALWVPVAAVCLLVSSAHVPSDIVGGLLFGLLAVLVVYLVLATEWARRRE